MANKTQQSYIESNKNIFSLCRVQDSHFFKIWLFNSLVNVLEIKYRSKFYQKQD